MGVARPRKLIGTVPGGGCRQVDRNWTRKLPLYGRNCRLAGGIPDSGKNTNSDEARIFRIIFETSKRTKKDQITGVDTGKLRRPLVNFGFRITTPPQIGRFQGSGTPSAYFSPALTTSNKSS